MQGGLILRRFKTFEELNKNISISFRSYRKVINRHFTNDVVLMTNKHMEGHSMPVVSREISIHAIMRSSLYSLQFRRN